MDCMGHTQSSCGIVSAFLVVEKEIITDVLPNEVATALPAAFYVFNMQYPHGRRMVGMLLEILLLDKVPHKVPSKIGTILSTLQSVSL